MTNKEQADLVRKCAEVARYKGDTPYSTESYRWACEAIEAELLSAAERVGRGYPFTNPTSQPKVVE